MNHKIASTMILKKGKFVGWKVYIDGKKYPKKPQVMYAGILEDQAIRLAFKEAGLDPDTVKDIINSEIDIPDHKCRVCGCTDLTPCPGGCAWVQEDLCSACAPDVELFGMGDSRGFWLKPLIVPVNTNTLQAMAVHGALCLALRHPQFRGEGDRGHASRQLVVEFTKSLGEWLIHVGALTPEQLKEVQQLEAEEGSPDLR